MTEPGAVERAVRADVDALLSDHPMGEALAEVAFFAARQLDVGVADTAKAPILRELREALADLAATRVGDDGLAAALSVPTTIRDSAES